MKRTRQDPLELCIPDFPEVPGKVDGFGESGQVGDRKGSCHLQLRGASNTFFFTSPHGKRSKSASRHGPKPNVKKGTCSLGVRTQVVSKVEFISRHVLNFLFLEFISRFLNSLFYVYFTI